ncbi:hypothetical protein C8D76_101279 [Pasteurella langaaensis DSM 22999]|uniref:Calcineurin-like phosphoesterase domain-containing protein n=1 Tax=Alitibacter langaaensis DSM 22999 TaxID=1122935 RepID=A0A2U0TH53_9PAST|nr:metallophosphoesterase [Pasteurella langaaensis]PVX42943.1 hypothetical protein C8D76_101279 [Pasteurella langaaensis DSM 22999]
MELRYYIIFGVIALVLQLFLFIFDRTLRWFLQDLISKKARLALSVLIFVVANSIIFLTILRIFPHFRLSAWILVFLLYSAFSSLACFVLAKLGHKWENSLIFNRTLRYCYPLTLIGLFVLSLYNAYTPHILHYQISIDKTLQPLRIGVASDFHLGTLFGGKQLDELADIFNREKVDLILLPGDIMDDNVNAYLAEKMQPHLAKLQAPLGVYATLGNHDFFGDQKRIETEVRKAGLKLLEDESVVVNGQFTLIGRNDNLAPNRPETEQLLKTVNTSLPVFLMDHRPDDVIKHSKLPIDLQVSGHTHKGQIFPANVFTQLMYDLSYGYKQLGHGHYFVTSGYGFWGVPLRLGSQSEVLIIDVQGK